MSLPAHRERQFMQHLRGGGWVKASAAPAGELLIINLLAKGWIERRGQTPNSTRLRVRVAICRSSRSPRPHQYLKQKNPKATASSIASNRKKFRSGRELDYVQS